MDGFLHDYAIVAAMGALGVMLAAVGLTASRLLQPRRPNAHKSETYESGVEPQLHGWSQSHVRYYLYALLFVVFDIEVAFIVPWAVQVESFGVFGLVEMLLFVGILALGLAYAWRKGALRWDS